MILWVIYLSVGPNKAPRPREGGHVHYPPGYRPHALVVRTPRLRRHGGSLTGPRRNGVIIQPTS